MTTPNKLSLSLKKKNKATQPIIVLSDSDEDKENDILENISSSGRSRNSRRCSTILAGAGNFLPVVHRGRGVFNQLQEEEEDESEISLISNITVRTRRGDERLIQPVRRKEDVYIPVEPLITDDESDFFSCQGSPSGEMNKALLKTWMTDITMNEPSCEDDRASNKNTLEKVKTPNNSADHTPTNNFADHTPANQKGFRTSAGGTQKKSSLFASVSKKNTQEIRSPISISSDSDLDVPDVENVVRRLERTVIKASDSEEEVLGPTSLITDDESTKVTEVKKVPVTKTKGLQLISTPPVGKEFLTNSKYGTVRNWVAQSPFSSKLDITVDDKNDDKEIDDEDIDNLLRSDPEDDNTVPSWAAPIPIKSSSRKKPNSSSSKTSRLPDDGSWNTNSKVSKPPENSSQGTSKAGGSWNTGSKVSRLPETKSQGTSKAGGSWNESSKVTILSDNSCQGTSKAGGSWNSSSQPRLPENSSQGTSKAGGSWNISSKIDEINEVSLKGNPVTKGISPAGNAGTSGQIHTELSCQGTSKAVGRWNNSNCNLGTNDSVSQLNPYPKHTNKVGVSPTIISNNKVADVNVTELISSSQGTSKAGGSWNKSSEGSSQPTVTDGPNSVKVRKKKWNKDWIKDVPTNDTDVDQTVSDFDKLRLTPLVTNSSIKSSQKLISSSRQTNSGDQPSLNLQLSSSDVGTSSVPLIDNSVCGAAVRSWEEVKNLPSSGRETDRNIPSSGQIADVWGKLSSTGQVTSQESVKVELQNINDSSDSEGELNKFLNNIKKSKKKKVAQIASSDDDNFIVPDEDSEDTTDDEFSAPKLNLRERLLDKVGANPKKGNKPRILSKSSSSSSSLPDIDSPVIPSSVTKRRPARGGVKKQFNFDSDDSGSEASDVDNDSSDEDSFVNIYKPKNCPDVPPTPEVDSIGAKKPPVSRVKKSVKKATQSPLNVSAKKTPKPKSGVGGSKLSPQNPFKTPIVTGRQNSYFQLPTPSLTFLSSLTTDTPIERCHPEARKYIKNFNKTKTELGRRLFDLYNKEVFDNALPEDMQIDWNKRLTKTAGLCYSRRAKNRFGIETRTARLELSTKVIDRGERLRDTLIHEMCHAASWIISGYRDGHGPLWRSWGEKATKRFPELPLIGRCHSYVIETKYSYCCTKCGYTIGRHSKSLDTDKKVCGKCHGPFQLMVNGKPAGGSSTKTPNGGSSTPNPFALFVKDNYKIHKRPGVDHAEVMRILSGKFAATKLDNKV